MKKQTVIIFSLMISFVVLFTSCKSDDNINTNPEPNTFSENWGTMVQRDFKGTVIDEDNKPLEGAEVKIGDDYTTTDINGIFIIRDANVYQEFAYITVEKAGYLKASRSMIPTTGINNVSIKVLVKELVNTVTSDSESESVLSDGTTVKFDGAFKDENGNTYTGNVSVYMHHLSPSDTDINKTMPGMLYAQNANNEERVLETYGMVNVELRGSGGEKLNLANGHTATIEIPIDASQPNTPNTIELWHFDDEKGYWIEDGSATKIGNKYVGEVSHFSWWNCDAQFPTVNLCMNITDANNVALSNIKIELSSDTISPSVAFSDGNGNVCGLIPSNTLLDLKIYSICGNLIYTSTVGPFASDTNIPLVLSSLVPSISGNLLDCNNENVTNGYILFDYNGTQITTLVNNGAFSLSTAVCIGNTFVIEGIDTDNIQSTGVINQTFSFPNTNMGNIIACGNTPEYIFYQVDNEPIVVMTQSIGANIYGSGFNVDGSTSGSTNNYIFITCNSTLPGVYNSPNFDIIESSIDIDYYTSTPTNIQFVLSNYGAIGEYIDMTFSGTYTATNGATKNITGTVHVKRDN